MNSEFRAVAAVYRIRTDSSGLHIERHDAVTDTWTLGPGTFLSFVNEGELGADEISEEQAERLIAAGLPPLPQLSE